LQVPKEEKEEGEDAVPKPSRSRRPAAQPAAKKPAARARAPTTKKAAQEEEEQEKVSPCPTCAGWHVCCCRDAGACPHLRFDWSGQRLTRV